MQFYLLFSLVCISVLVLLLITVVCSKRSKTHVKKHHHSAKNHLREDIKVTEAHTEPQSKNTTWPTVDPDLATDWSYWDIDYNNVSISWEEFGKASELLDLSGDINEKFAFKATAADPSTSMICSPLSAMMPLGILTFGAGNHKTEKELLLAVGLNEKSKAHDFFKDLRSKIKNLAGPTTNLASRIYVNSEKKLNDGFKKQAEDTFGSCVDTADMKNKTNTAKVINHWVKEHTQKKIKHIVNDEDIAPSTSVIIVNAIYFHALWKDKFEGTKLLPFYGAKGQMELKFMYRKGYYMYGASRAVGAKTILIPYKGDASMFIILPKAKDGLELLLEQLKLAPDALNNIKMNLSFVNLQVPKFKIETAMDLKFLYKEVGLAEIFSPATGLERLVKDGNIVIDKAIQKAMIEVDELGTVGPDASTSMVSGAESVTSPPDTISLIADHPFLFFIIAHKQQLFAGTFVG